MFTIPACHKHESLINKSMPGSNVIVGTLSTKSKMPPSSIITERKQT